MHANALVNVNENVFVVDLYLPREGVSRACQNNQRHTKYEQGVLDGIKQTLRDPYDPSETRPHITVANVYWICSISRHKILQLA